MARYELTSPDGQRFEITAPEGAGEQQVMEYFQQNYQSQPETTLQPELPVQDGGGSDFLASTEKYVRPALEFGGLLAGGAVGSTVGPVGSVGGAGLGYAGGKQLADILYDDITTLPEELVETGKDIATGASMEAGGQVLGKILPWTFAKGGEAVKAVMGRLTGTGKAAMEDAIASGKQMGVNPFKNYTEFDKALRGKITGEDVVVNAKSALGKLKDMRSADYVKRLEKIKLSPTKLTEAKTAFVGKLKKLISKDKFDIRPVTDDAGEIAFDFSKSTLVESQPVINKALQDVVKWDDMTPAGLDVLKKRLSTYAKQVKRGTPQEAFLTQLEGELSKQLKTHVPGYAKMTKGYSEATELIKDIESGMMLRKEGMSGRIRADMTLRKLMSSVKDNFELRRDLVKALSAEGDDITGQVSGYVSRSIVPLGLSGTGSALIGSAAAAKFMSPAFWPVLAASSPRVSAEFLRVFGKGLSEVAGTGPTIGKAIAYEAQRKKKNALNNKTDNVNNLSSEKLNRRN